MAYVSGILGCYGRPVGSHRSSGFRQLRFASAPLASADAFLKLRRRGGSGGYVLRPTHTGPKGSSVITRVETSSILARNGSRVITNAETTTCGRRLNGRASHVRR